MTTHYFVVGLLTSFGGALCGYAYRRFAEYEERRLRDDLLRVFPSSSPASAAESLRDAWSAADRAASGPWEEDGVDDRPDGRRYRQSSVTYWPSGTRHGLSRCPDVAVDTLNASSSFDEEDRQAIGDFVAACKNLLPAVLTRLSELEEAATKADHPI